MKICKMVFGILNCILFVWITFQSCAANVINAVQQSDDTSGLAGLLFAFLLLGASIAAIATRNNTDKIPNLIISLVYWVAGFVAKQGANGLYKDLNVWAMWAWICAGQVLFTYAFAELKKQKEAPPAVPPVSQTQQPHVAPSSPKQPPKQPQTPRRSTSGIANIAHKKLDEL